MVSLTGSREIFDALALLTPFDTNSLGKIRVGAPHDGGYVMLDDLQNTPIVYSFGIGGQVEFDEQLAAAGKQVFMFDHTIQDLPRSHPNFNFVREGLGGADEPEKSIFTLKHHMHRLGHAFRDDLTLKIDVEGAEYEALISTSTGVLLQFRQIVLELHWLSRLQDQAFRTDFVRAMEKINSVFTLCHVHANNCGHITTVDGFVVADVLELTYMRSDLIEVRPSRTVYPTGIDHANAWWAPDHLLWFYPFLPMVMDDITLAKDAIRTSLHVSEQTMRAHHAKLRQDHIARLEGELHALRSEGI